MNLSSSKPLLVLLGALVATGASGQTVTESASLLVGLNIPDNNPTGLVSTITFSSDLTSLTDVNVLLNISGGWNGDLYASLVHDSGLAVLLNRVGRQNADLSGYSDPGFSVMLDDEAVRGDIHRYRLALFGNPSTPVGGALTGVWAPDGRSVEPLLALDSDSRTSLLSSFHNLDAQGAWTLTLKDVSPGDVSQLVSWSLEVTGQVPEPSAALLWLTAAPGLWWMLRGRTKPLRNGPSPFPPS